jgi:hypothetical protein
MMADTDSGERERVIPGVDGDGNNAPPGILPVLAVLPVNDNPSPDGNERVSISIPMAEIPPLTAVRSYNGPLASPAPAKRRMSADPAGEGFDENAISDE